MKLVRKLFSCSGSHLEQMTNSPGMTGASNRPCKALLMVSQVAPITARKGLRKERPAEIKMEANKTHLGPRVSARYPPGIWAAAYP